MLQSLCPCMHGAYNFIVKPAQCRVTAQLAHSCFLYLLGAAPCHAVDLADFPQWLLLIIPAAQNICFTVRQLFKRFFDHRAQLILKQCIFYRVQFCRRCRVFLQVAQRGRAAVFIVKGHV